MYPVPSQTKVGTPFGAKCCGNTGRPHYWSLHIHKGVDFPAPTGTPVVAAWGGTVIDVSWGSAFGTHIIIDTDTLPDGTAGLWVGYMHLSKKLVKPGDKVKAGQKIGEVGATGNVSGPHLHMEVQRSKGWSQTGYYDPSKWLDANAYSYLQDKKVYASKMVYGQLDSDSVRNVQIALNEKINSGLPITGNYLDMTKAEVTKWQTKQGWSGSGADGIVGPLTAQTLGLVWVADETQPESPKSPFVEKLKAALADIPNINYVNGWDDPARAGNGEFTPEYVLMHHTAGTNSLGWLLPGGSHATVCGANFLVDKDGKVNVLSAYKAYHAGKGNYGDVPTDKMNDFSWGIEIESLGTKQDMPAVQVEAAANVAAALVSMMETPINHIINHKTYSSTGKQDTLYSDEFWQNKAAGIEVPVEFLTKDKADNLYLSIDTPYTTLTETDTRYLSITTDMFTKEEADALYLPLSYEIPAEYLKRSEADGLYMSIDATIPTDYLTIDVADARYMSINTTIPADYLTRSQADALYMSLKARFPKYYEYTGKPSGTQDITDGRYERIKNGNWTPPEAGFLMSMLYANCDFTLKPGYETGTIRVRAVREAWNGQPDDQTAYQDFTVTKNHFGGSFLITHEWFEWCDANRNVRWEIRSSDHFSSMVIDTRYTKWVLFPA